MASWREILFPLALLLLAALLFLWTWTETAVVSVDVAHGRCVARLYGRSSAIDCPDLAGGRLELAFVAAANAAAPPTATTRLMPAPAWAEVALAPGAAGALPAAFSAQATLRRPRGPAAVVLLRPNSRTGWAFVLDVDGRRGTWWQWAGGPLAPLRGIPLDRPAAENLKPLVRQVLSSLLPAAALAALLRLLSKQSSVSGEQSAVVSGQWSVAGGRRSFVARRSSFVVRSSSFVAPLLAFAIALHVSLAVLEGAPHVQDSVTYLFQAQTLARGHLTAPAPPLATADGTAHFAQEFLLVRDGRWFGKYPPGFPAVLAVGVRAGAPWLVNPLLAALTVALVQLGIRNYELGIGRKERQTTNYELRTTIANHRALATDHRPLAADHRPLTTDHRPLATDHRPLATDHRALATDHRPLAADHRPLTTDNWPLTTDHYLLLTANCLLVTSPFFLVMSGSLMAHPAELFWTTLFMVAWAAALAARTPGPAARRALVAGAALGALFLTRQFTAATVGLAFGGGLAFGVWRGRPEARRALRRAAVLAAAAALPLLLALPAYQAAVTGDARADPRLLYWPYDRVGFGPGVGEAQNAFTVLTSDAGPALVWTTDPGQPPRGHSVGRGLYNLGRNFDALAGDLFGWPPALTFVFLWLAFLLRRPAAGDWLLLCVVVAVAGGYVAYWAAGIAYGPRYFYAALPALVLLSARGVSALAAVAGRRPAMVALALLLAWNLAHLPGHIAGYRDYNFVDPGARSAVAGVQTPALVFVSGGTDWWDYGVFFSGNTPWLDGPVVYARDLGAVEDAALRAAFPDRRAYRWTGATLLPLP